MNIKQVFQTKARQALGIEKGYFGFTAEPKFGLKDIVERGNYTSMLEANVGRVWNCVNLLSLDMAQVPFQLFVPGKDEDKQIFDHIFFDLIKMEPFHNTFELKYMTEAHLNLTGNAYWHTPLNSFGRPAGLRFLFSNRVTPRFNEKTKEQFYEYDNKGKIIIFPKEEIVHFRFPNPQSDLRGMGPVEAARKKINLIEYMEEYQLVLLGNRAIPPGYIKTEEILSKEDVKKLKLAWKKDYGGIEKAGEIAVFGKNSDFVKLVMSPEDLQFLESTEFTEEQLGAMFGVSPYKLGRVKDVNRANAYELEKSYQKQTITPRLVMRDITLTEELVQKYDKKLFLKSPNVVPEDKEFELKQDTELFKTASITPNQIAKKWGYEPFEGGDVRLVPFNLTPLSSLTGEQPKKQLEPIKDFKDVCSIARTKDWKEKYWKAYVGRTEKRETQVIKGLKPFFDAQEKIVLANIRKFRGKDYKASEVYLPSKDEENAKIIKTMKPLMLATVVSGGETLTLDFELVIEGGFQGNALILDDWFKTREMLIKNINRTTFDALTETINEGINQGETIKQISERVTAVYDDARGYRSANIARTEVNTATNFGHMEAMRQANISKKDWITANDEKVRETHEINGHDGCITREGTFSGTGELYPGQPRCRCTVIPCVG